MIGSGIASRDRLVVLVQAFLRGLVVVRRDREDAVRAQLLQLARQFDHLARVVAARAGQHRHLAAWLLRRVISTTRRCSARVSVGLSPVVPQGTRKLMPASICRRTSLRSVASSSDRSRRNGVTSAVPHPVNMCHLQCQPLALEQNFAEFVKALLARPPTAPPSARRARSLRGCAPCAAA